MVLIFDEYKEAERLIKAGFSNGINYKELVIIGKYYRFNGLGIVKIRKNLILFCKKWITDFNDVKYRKLISVASRKAMLYNLRSIKNVGVTYSEIEKIQSVRDFKKQKFLFCLLVYAKALKFSTVRKKQTRSELHGYFVKIELLREIKKIAGITESFRTVQFWLNEFYLAGLLGITGKTIKVLFVSDKGPFATIVDSEDSIVSSYTNYCGGVVSYCKDCHEPYTKTGKRDIYCPTCTKKRRQMAVRNSVRRYRERNK